MEDGFQRKQFTFYRSFFEAVQTISNKQRRAEIYDMLCRFALDGTEPDWQIMTAIQKSTMLLVMPVLRSAWEKAKNGKEGGSKPKANCKQTKSKKENEIEIEKENKKEIDIECEYEKEGTAWASGQCRELTHTFDIFWNLYPKKVCKEQAWQAFQKVDVPFSVLEQAIGEQRKSSQWRQDSGKYIPNPATWLEQRRWEDELPAPAPKEVKASGRIGPEEREAIRRMMEGH